MNITIPREHENPVDCQLILALTGPQAEIISKLQRIVIDLHNGAKPRQCTALRTYLTETTITPIWNGTQY